MEAMKAIGTGQIELQKWVLGQNGNLIFFNGPRTETKTVFDIAYKMVQESNQQKFIRGMLELFVFS